MNGGFSAQSAGRFYLVEEAKRFAGSREESTAAEDYANELYLTRRDEF